MTSRMRAWMFAGLTILGAAGLFYVASNSPRVGDRPSHTEGSVTPAGPIRLVLRDSFPGSEQEKEDVYLYQGVSVAKDEAGHILALDFKAKTVLEFQPNGRFVRKFGRGGQGPGEFGFPVKILCHGKSRYVLDSRRIHVFDQAGKYKRGMMTQRSYFDLVVNADGTLFAARQMKYGGDRLVDALDSEGHILFSFAELEQQGSIPPGLLNEVRLATDDQGMIILAFRTLGKLRAYEKKGVKLRDVQLQGQDIDRERAYNMHQFAVYTPGGTGYHHIIEAVRCRNGRTYVMRMLDKGLEIMALDRDSRPIVVFRYATAEQFLPSDFEVAGDSQNPVFFVLENSPENRIDVLVPGKSSP